MTKLDRMTKHEFRIARCSSSLRRLIERQRAMSITFNEPERRTPVRREQTLSSNDCAGPEAGAPIPQFMVPMHSEKRKGAFHEQHRPGTCSLLWESGAEVARTDRKSTRLNSSHGYISY